MLYKGDTLYLDWLEDGIAELVFDAPGSVNKLDTATVASLGEAIGVLEQQSDLKGLLLRSNKAAFIVGADITEFLSLFLVPEEQLSQWLHFANSVFNRLEDLLRCRPLLPSMAMRWAVAANACWRPIIVWRRRICASVCRKPNWASCRALAVLYVCHVCWALTVRWKSLPLQ